MKKFNIQSQVIFMCGISGSGKTHFALQLESQGFSRLSTDALIWEKIGDKLFSLPRDEQKRLFAECREEIYKKLVDHLNGGKKVVVDATHCKRSVRDDLRNLCAKNGVNPVFVYCYADKDELKRRLSQRKGSGPDDLIVREEDLHNYWLGFERPQNDESDFIFCKTD